MRLASACVECRTSKRRCRIQTGQTACESCIRRQVDCSLQPPALRKANPTTHLIDHRKTDLVAIHGEALVRRMVGKYLDLIHDRPNTLFHVASLWRDFENKSIPDTLLITLCATGARLLPECREDDLQHRLTALAHETLNSNIDDISLATVQSCILFANLCAADLEAYKEALYFGVANRMACLMKLDQISPDDSAVLCEVKRRVWWTLVMADNWCSAGLGVQQQLRTEDCDIPLPRDEYEFQRLDRNVSQAEHTITRPGIWAYSIQLVDLFKPINTLNQQRSKSEIDEDTARERTYEIGRLLDSWEQALPSHMRLNQANLEDFREIGLGGAFIALHLGYFHYSTLLYFRYLDQQHNGDSYASAFAHRCKEMAAGFCALLRQSRSLSGCEAVYATVGHMTVVSSSVLLHNLLFGTEEELPEIRANLTSNFTALVELRTYWPCLQRMIQRLLDFQEACMRAGSTNTHRVDEWMVKFLTVYSVPLDRRASEDPTEIAAAHETAHVAADDDLPAELLVRGDMATEALAWLTELDDVQDFGSWMEL